MNKSAKRIIALIMTVGIITTTVGCSKENENGVSTDNKGYTEGTYVGKATGNGGEIKVDVNKINKVNESLKNDFENDNEESGYGLYNVNRRLKLNFRKEYGVKLEANKNEVIAIVKHPVLTEG